MNYGIQYLCHLVQTKNDLNRRRRRFYSIVNPRYELKDKPMRKVYHEHPEFAEKMYKQPQKEMKAMTATMRAARKELNAWFKWGYSHNILWIDIGESRYDVDQIARLAELYKADAILLGD